MSDFPKRQLTAFPRECPTLSRAGDGLISQRHPRTLSRVGHPLLLVLAVVMFAAGRADASGVTARVGDVTRIKGQRTNTLIGMGLVTGLNGTGDGDEYLPSMRPLAAALKQFANPVSSIEELGGSKNVAIVMLEAVLPEFGVREGGTVDEIGRAHV